MPFRWLALGVLILLAAAAPAPAAEIQVLQDDGSTERRHDPGVDARDTTPHPQVRGGRTVRALTARRRTAMSELRRLRRQGAIPRATYVADRRIWREAKRLRTAATGLRELEIDGQMDVLNGIAARGQLTASRVAPLFHQLDRNRQWWGNGPLLASGQRVSFKGSELLFQYVPGEGLQIHPLGNFGKLNGLWGTRGARERMVQLMNELLAIGAERAGGIAWEYYFDFGGGSPPWVSGLAQGTALQALARASKKAGSSALTATVLKRGLAVFETRTPAGVRVPRRRGTHYAQYSYAPSLRIINGFIQSVTGLYDYATISGDREAMRLFREGDAQASREVPTFDTGAWSLYSRGSITRESDLHYHNLLKGFLDNLCERTSKRVYCGAAGNFGRYTGEGPRVKVITRRLRAGRANALRFTLSKISDVTVRLRRGGETVLTYGARLGYGTRSISVRPPPSARRYSVSIAATDLAGNTGATRETVSIVD